MLRSHVMTADVQGGSLAVVHVIDQGSGDAWGFVFAAGPAAGGLSAGGLSEALDPPTAPPVASSPVVEPATAAAVPAAEGPIPGESALSYHPPCLRPASTGSGANFSFQQQTSST